MRYAVPILVAFIASGSLLGTLGFIPNTDQHAVSSRRSSYRQHNSAIQKMRSKLALVASASDTAGDADGSPSDALSNEEYAEIDWDWRQMATDVFSEDTRPIVLFDGVCNLCNGGVNFAIDQDETARLRFASLQSKVAKSLLLRCGKSPTDTSSIIYVTEDEAFYSSDAVSHICMDLDAKPLRWFGQLGQFTPSWIRESVYQFVSDNRYQFGENDSCRLDFDGTYTSRFVSDPMNKKDDAGIDTSEA
mmetsp:Transcript_26373/g.76112  ORF Transcript_26373/g.76112 Transcript_26373/m.76112 type:complete len:247 (-) Transcript_26373:46-786(-)